MIKQASATLMLALVFQDQTSGQQKWGTMHHTKSKNESFVSKQDSNQSPSLCTQLLLRILVSHNSLILTAADVINYQRLFQLEPSQKVSTTPVYNHHASSKIGKPQASHFNSCIIRLGTLIIGSKLGLTVQNITLGFS